jgi:Na+/proline symporter
MVGITWIQAKYSDSSPANAEEFNSASHSVKPGLIACGIVSAWSWAATLLQSSAVTYKYGISGSWWYASGACVQVLLFGCVPLDYLLSNDRLLTNASRRSSMLACKLKLNAPGAATYIEIIGCRWGTFAHLTFLVFGLIANIVVSTVRSRGHSHAGSST